MQRTINGFLDFTHYRTHRNVVRQLLAERARPSTEWLTKGVAILGIRTIMREEESFLCWHCFQGGASSVVAKLAESAKTKDETILSPNPREEAHSHERAHNGYRRRFKALEGAHRRFQHGK